MQTLALNIDSTLLAEAKKLAKELQMDSNELILKALEDFIYLKMVEKMRRKLRGTAEVVGILSEEELFEAIS